MSILNKQLTSRERSTYEATERLRRAEAAVDAAASALDAAKVELNSALGNWRRVLQGDAPSESERPVERDPPGAPSGAVIPGGERNSQIYEFLRTRTDATLEQVTAAVFGDVSANTRSLASARLHTLKKHGLVEFLRPGVYAVAAAHSRLGSEGDPS